MRDIVQMVVTFVLVVVVGLGVTALFHGIHSSNLTWREAHRRCKRRRD